MGKGKRGKWILKTSLVLFTILAIIAVFPGPSHKSIDQLIESPHAVSDPAFRDVIERVSGAPLVPGNHVVPLINGVEIFPRQIEAIRGARKSITMENFIFRSGQLSAELVPLLAAKARDGVKVHLIMDSMGCSKLKQEELAQLEDAGVRFVKYNRTEWHKLLRINHRDHRKLCIVDGRIGFTGGACLADEWLGNAETKEQWRDTHFQVTGPAVGFMQGVFVDNWIQTESELLHRPEFFPPLPSAGTMLVQSLKSGPDEGVELARMIYLYSIASARRHIRIAHSYFVPDDLLVKQLVDACRRGVKVEIITPGIIDANVVRRASRARWGELLEAGVEFYEYQPALYHPKIMVIDDCWVVAGTLNFDNRSFRINDENMLNVWDPGLAAELVRVFASDQAKSRRITRDDYRRRPWHEKAGERLASWFRLWL